MILQLLLNDVEMVYMFYSGFKMVQDDFTILHYNLKLFLSSDFKMIL